MTPDPSDPLEFEDWQQWRQWLEAHNNNEAEAWLVIYRKKHADLGLALAEAVEEGLCFGWIDGVLQPLDEKRYLLRFSPRKGNSIWSVNNIQRVEKLIAGGKMTAAGYRVIEEAKDNGEWVAALRREQVDIIPADLESALLKEEGAITAYQELPDSQKKQYIYWLQTAKREDTVQKRIQKIVQEVLKK